jgi:hypothetical protein
MDGLTRGLITIERHWEAGLPAGRRYPDSVDFPKAGLQKYFSAGFRRTWADGCCEYMFYRLLPDESGIQGSDFSLPAGLRFREGVVTGF